MNPSSLWYLVRQGVHGLRVNRLMSAASVAALVLCLSALGAAVVAGIVAQNLVQYLGSQNETVVYLNPDATAEQTAALEQQLRALDGVAQVEYLSKQAVLQTYVGYMAQYASLWEDLQGEDNPFYANFRVTVSDLSQLPALAARMEKLDGVESVSAPTRLSAAFVRLCRILRAAGLAAVAALGVVSAVVVGNTIRLTVFARRREIGIMKYVGATNTFIRFPFFVEGMAAGLLAGALATGLVLGGYALALGAGSGVSGLAGSMLAASLPPLAQLGVRIPFLLLCGGAFLGSLGTASSIRRYLAV